MSAFRAFSEDRRGGVALMFALGLLPALAAVGAAIEYSRATNVQALLQLATDSAVLAANRQPPNSSLSARTAAARRAFDANFNAAPGVSVSAFNVAQEPEKLTVTASARYPMLFGGVLNSAGFSINSKAESLLGAMRLEISLVLDTTGSMGRRNKMTVLKQAASDLVDAVMQAKADGNEVYFSVVPFNTQVRVPVSHRNDPWLRFTTSDPDPKMNAQPATWDGCIADRNRPLNKSALGLSLSDAGTKFPAVNCQYNDMSELLPLSTDPNVLKARINSMNPTGNTNTVIGLAWGVNSLTQGAPMSGPAQAAGRRVVKSLVFLTDGLNTEDRFSRNSADIDISMTDLCSEVRRQTLSVYTIRVIDGDATLLRNCASDHSMFFDASSAGQLLPIFQEIARKLTAVRISS